LRIVTLAKRGDNEFAEPKLVMRRRSVLYI
jgi:hypothetical protein